MLYYSARYYDWMLGRFISADTIVPSAANPQALNRYAYVLNNPLKYTDPSGHWECEEEGCEQGKGERKPPKPAKRTQEDKSESKSTAEIIKIYRDVLQQVKEACLQGNPNCYDGATWWWVDLFAGADDDYLAKVIKQAREAYWKQGINLDEIVAMNQNNPLLLELLVPPSQFGEWIPIFRNALRSPIIARYLQVSGLKTTHQSNYEPFFLIMHISQDWRPLLQSATWCAVAPNCLMKGE